MIETGGWWFETERFRDCTETEDEVNPGRYGDGLSAWLAEALRARGWEVDGTFPEDWGWRVSLTRGGCRMYVCCANEDGSTVRWLVYPEAWPGLLQRLLRRVDARPLVDELDGALEEILRADAMTRWCARDQPEESAVE